MLSLADRLFQALGSFELERCDAAGISKIRDRCVYCRDPLRFADHFDPDFDIYISDPMRGSLGVVRCLEKTNEIQSPLTEAIDQATYLRHLLLEDNDLPTGHRAPAVELVVVLLESAYEEVSDTMVRIAWDSPSYLEAIGVNFLQVGADLLNLEEWAANDVEHAFPWLLRRCQSWFESSSTADLPQGRSIRLDNYRIPGVSELVLAPEHRVHCVHGRNGSGKSTFSEAIELLLTGRVERLERQTPGLKRESLSEILLHSGNGVGRNESKGSVELFWGEFGPRVLELTRGQESIEIDPLAPGMAATTFRLDQFAMERLAHSTESERAAIFLESFFPHESERIQKYRSTAARYKEARSRIEDLAKPFLPDESLLQTSIPQSAEEWFERCLPISITTLDRLTICAPKLREIHDLWKVSSSIPEEKDFRNFDGLWEQLLEQIDNWRALVDRAISGLDKLKGWSASDQAHVIDSFASSLDEWLELCALTDLAEKQIEITTSITRAERDGWQRNLPKMLLRSRNEPTSTEYRDLASKLAQWTERRNSLRAFLGADEQLPKESLNMNREQPAVGQFVLRDREALDAVGSWVIVDAESEDVGFGQRILDSIEGRESLSFGSTLIGSTGWTEPIRKDLETLRDTFDEVIENRSRSGRTLQRFRAWNELADAKNQFEAAGIAAEETFVKQLTDNGGEPNELAEALNELLKLMTPARWAYPKLDLTYDDKVDTIEDFDDSAEYAAGAIRIAVADEGSRADLRFNTAELNLMTIGLFLLCGTRVKENPLRLLIFDDPLQNMDELTVTTFSRGLTRLLECLPKDWTFLFLFHGEEDLQRFGSEVPAAIYRLEWLRLRGSGHGRQEVERVEIGLDHSLHWPGSLLKARPSQSGLG